MTASRTVERDERSAPSRSARRRITAACCGPGPQRQACPTTRSRGPRRAGSRRAREDVLPDGRDGDGQCSGSTDREPERALWPGCAYAAGRHGSSQRCRVGHRALCHLAPADLSSPVPRLSVTQVTHTRYVDHRCTAVDGSLDRSAYLIQMRRPVPVVLRCHRPSLLTPSTKRSVPRTHVEVGAVPSDSTAPMTRPGTPPAGSSRRGGRLSSRPGRDVRGQPGGRGV